MAKRKMVRAVRSAPARNFVGLRPYALGHALGMLMIVFYGLFVWFGDYDPSFVVANYPIAFGFADWTFLFGLVQSYVLFYVLGWVFAKLYNSV